MAGNQAWQSLLFTVFVGLGTVLKLAQHSVRDLHYNFLCPVILVSFAKLIASLLFYKIYDRGGFAHIPSLLKKEYATVLGYSVVSGLFAAYDVLSFVNLAKLDPATFLTLMQLRTVITAAIWEIAFDKPLHWAQRVGLVCVCIGCMLKQGLGDAHFGNVTLSDYTLLGAQVAINCLAGVANEVFLKRKGAMPLNLQNAIQYTWAIIFCLAMAKLCPIQGIGMDIFAGGEWYKMADSRMLFNILIMTGIGLTCSVMLKTLDSIWKSIATALELFCTTWSASLMFGYAIHATDILALITVGAGASMYGWFGRTKAADMDGEKKLLLPKSQPSKPL